MPAGGLLGYDSRAVPPGRRTGSRRRRSVAANSLGEEKSPAQSRGVAPARIAALAALAAVVVALAIVLFGGGGSHRYDLLFQNASQLVPDNQVLIGGQPVGSVDSIDLTEDNLARIEVSVSQQLHEGTTAVVRATSLSGVANHYVSISPGPNSNPPLDEGAALGIDSTTTPADLDQLFNTFPPVARRGLANFIKGFAAVYAGRGPDANRTYKYFAPGLNRLTAFVGELNADQRLLERFVVSTSKLVTTIAQRGDELSSAVSNASTAFGAIASQNAAFSETLRLLPPVLRQGSTTFVNLRAALDDLDPLVETAKPATRDLAPFLRDLRPVISKAVPVFKNLRLTVRRSGFANDAGELLAALPTVQRRASRTFPHSEDAIADFQPFLNFARAYTPDIFNGFGKLGQVTGYYDGNGHYARTQPTDLNLFGYDGGSGVLEPIAPSQQYDAFGASAGVSRRCPGAATQPAADGSNPFTEPPFAGAGVTPSQCDPADVPPGP
ncbi:MAG: MCE family protein [Solirubrobacterales bacterium]|nr:MCE family protein [Solirubrobacterales bacterium]